MSDVETTDIFTAVGSDLKIKKFLFLVQSFDTLGTGLDSLSRRDANPLKIWIFSFFAGWIIFAAQLDQRG
jgi:hypothetical protein